MPANKPATALSLEDGPFLTGDPRLAIHAARPPPKTIHKQQQQLTIGTVENTAIAVPPTSPGISLLDGFCIDYPLRSR
jgi:hypothetical protein